MNTPTPTPRTDYLLSDYVTVDQLIDHAREIETELTAVTEQRDKLAELSGFGEFDKPTEP